MTEATPPRIEFPCSPYPIKVIGRMSEDFAERVLTCIAQHADLAGLPGATVPSREGRFVAMTVPIVATGEAQLQAMHRDLLAVAGVKLVI